MKPPTIRTDTGKVAASMLAGWGLDWADTIAAIEDEARGVEGIVESVLSVRLDDEPLRFDVNWNKGFAKAVGLFEAALLKDAMDADRPAGDQPAKCCGQW